MNLVKWLLLFLFFGGCQTQQKWNYPFPFIGLALAGFPVTEKIIEQSKDETKIDPAVIVFYLQWPSTIDVVEPILPSLEAIWNSGAVPCMTWEPMNIVDNVERAVPYQEILQGTYDSYLDWVASEIKSWDKLVIIRFAHEMNLSRYHWGTTLDDYGPSSTGIYVSLFQYVVSFFRNKHVDNVLWAFCPNADSVPNEDWNIAKNYYPGDEYVDILGMDGYNWNIDASLAKAGGQAWHNPWRSFNEIFEPIYSQLRKISVNKPLIVFETASVDRSQDEKKLLWIKEALNISRQWDIQGIVWFQVDKEEKWKFKQEKNSLIDSQPSFQAWLLKNSKDFR